VLKFIEASLVAEVYGNARAERSASTAAAPAPAWTVRGQTAFSGFARLFGFD
jgi:hypothetical protein